MKIKKRNQAFGVASSSSSLGHSLNFGKADLVSVVAKNIIIADGFATAISNRIKKVEDGMHDGQFKIPQLTKDLDFQKNFEIEEEIHF